MRQGAVYVLDLEDEGWGVVAGLKAACAARVPDLHRAVLGPRDEQVALRE